MHADDFLCSCSPCSLQQTLSGPLPSPWPWRWCLVWALPEAEAGSSEERGTAGGGRAVAPGWVRTWGAAGRGSAPTAEPSGRPPRALWFRVLWHLLAVWTWARCGAGSWAATRRAEARGAPAAATERGATSEAGRGTARAAPGAGGGSGGTWTGTGGGSASARAATPAGGEGGGVAPCSGGGGAASPGGCAG